MEQTILINLVLTCMVVTGLAILMSLAFHIMWKQERKMHDDTRKDQREQFDKWYKASKYAISLEKKLMRLKK